MKTIDEIENHFNQMADRIYSGKLKPHEIDAELTTFVSNNLLKGVQSGYGKHLNDIDYSTPDGDMLNHLQKNVWLFGGAKVWHQQQEMSDMITDNEGKVKPFNQYKADVLSIYEKYNASWLASEYNHAVASSQMAATWVRINQDKETYPNLRYQTIRDNHVRPEHQALEGVTKPINDSVWNKYYPPNGWGCRCDVIQMHGDVKITADKNINYPADAPKIFQTNCAKQRIVFPKDHPYFKNLPAGELEQIQAQVIKLISTPEYNNYDEANYIKHYYDDNSGGYVVINKTHDEDEKKETLPAAIKLAKKGHRVVLNGYTEGQKNPDYIIDGMKADLKTIKKYSNLKRTIPSKIEEANEQIANTCVIECKPSEYDADYFKRRIKGGLNPKYNKHVNEVWVLHGNEIIYFKRNELW